MTRGVWFIAGCSLAAGALAQPTSVVNSPHNLSASGPGRIKAVGEEQVCVFCHAPHNSSPVRPLWNRAMPTDAYTIYGSRSLTAKPEQPTGVSKMCLSCHDGTIALGSVLSQSTPIAMSGGVTTIPQGPSRLGTDLSDDHPISFKFDNAIVSKNPKLRSPSSLPPEVRLDANNELQCTSCHDAHNNQYGNFLVLRNENSQLCVSCHQMGQTTVNGHGKCSDCHQPHTAPSGPYLLRKSTPTDTCLICHSGAVPGMDTGANIANELHKLSAHDTNPPVDPPPPAQDNTSCIDCHEPHTMMHGTHTPPEAPPNFGKVKGVSASGAVVQAVSFEYEACFKCHADAPTGRQFVSRRTGELNTRLQFSPSAVSFHPVEAPGRNMIVPSLLPGWTTGSRVSCSSCHGSDAGRTAGGAGPEGIHGSRFAPNLIAQYETRDLVSESSQTYALCYKCHDRANILSNQSFPGHSQHIVDQRTPCAACHTAHGVSSLVGTTRNNAKLMNFATDIVFPDQTTGRLEYIDAPGGSGQCFLSCHGVTHSGTAYQTGGLRLPAGVRKKKSK